MRKVPVPQAGSSTSNLAVEQAVRFEVLAQGPVDLSHHESHHRDGGVIDTVLLARLGVEGGEEVLLEREHRVGTVVAGKRRGVDRVDGLRQHVERRSDQAEDFLLRQRPQRGAQ